MVTVAKFLYAVAESSGNPVFFVEAQNAPTAAALATGKRLNLPLSPGGPDWLIARVSPEQQAEIEALPADSVITYLNQLPGVIGRCIPIV